MNLRVLRVLEEFGITLNEKALSHNAEMIELGKNYLELRLFLNRNLGYYDNDVMNHDEVLALLRAGMDLMNILENTGVTLEEVNCMSLGQAVELERAIVEIFKC